MARKPVTDLRTWQTRKEGYSPENFYTRASDEKGHREEMRLKLPPAVMRELAEIVAARTWPSIRTPGDLVRDALIHRLHWLNERAPSRSLSLLLLTTRLAFRREQRDQEKAMLHQIEVELREADDADDRADVANHIRQSLPELKRSQRRKVEEIVARYE